MYIVREELLRNAYPEEFKQKIFPSEAQGVMTLEEMFDQLFIETEHGDEEHREWLKAKYTDFRNRLENEIDRFIF